jgi:hypothetical protein
MVRLLVLKRQKGLLGSSRPICKHRLRLTV